MRSVKNFFTLTNNKQSFFKKNMVYLFKIKDNNLKCYVFLVILLIGRCFIKVGKHII